MKPCLQSQINGMETLKYYDARRRLPLFHFQEYENFEYSNSNQKKQYFKLLEFDI